MSEKTFKILKLSEKDLDRRNIPIVVGANGSSLGALGQVECKFKIGNEICKQKFLVCQNLKRHLILGVDFTRSNAAGVHWTKHNSFVLTIDGAKVAETSEKHQLPSISLKGRTKIPPRMCAVVDVDINTKSKDKVLITGDEFCLTHNPNMYVDPIWADLSKRTEDSVCPLLIVNLSNDQHLELPKNHVVAFARKDDMEIESCFNIERVDTTPQHWIPQRPQQPAAEIAEIANMDLQECLASERLVARVDNTESVTDLHKVLTSASNFIKSPAEVEAHRKVDLEDKAISVETKVEFNNLCNRFQDIISQRSGDIGKTLLVEMDIETGNSPPIASRPYTLPLKHYDWVQKEIATLE